MGIAKNPLSSSKHLLTTGNQITADQRNFIDGSLEAASLDKPLHRAKTKPVMLRFPMDELALVDRCAKRVGLKRAAFILSSAIERAKKMESE